MTPDELDKIHERHVEEAVRQRDARRSAEEWPLRVQQILGALAARVVALEARIDDLQAGRG